MWMLFLSFAFSPAHDWSIVGGEWRDMEVAYATQEECELARKGYESLGVTLDQPNGWHEDWDLIVAICHQSDEPEIS